MKKIIVWGSMFAPALLFAQTLGDTKDVNNLVLFLKNGLLLASQLLLAAAVVYFLYNVFQFVVLSGGDAEKRDEARSGIIYGIIGIAVMASVWGLVNFFTGSLKLDNTGRTIESPIRF